MPTPIELLNEERRRQGLPPVQGFEGGDTAPNVAPWDTQAQDSGFGPVGPVGPQGPQSPAPQFGQSYNEGYSPPDTAPLPRAQSPSLMDAYGAAQNATRGFFTGDNPVDSVRRAQQGLMEGNSFPDAHYGFARLAPEGSELQRALDRGAAQLTDPLTLAFPGGGGLARASIGTAIGGGEAARQAARLAGYGEQGQENAGMIGNVVGGLAPSAPAIGRGIGRIARAADSALNPADLRVPRDSSLPTGITSAVPDAADGGVRRVRNMAGAAEDAAAGGAPELPGTPPRPPVEPPVAATPADAATNDFFGWVRRDTQLRRSGVPAAEIAQGRSAATGGLADVQSTFGGMSHEERVAAGRRARTVGPLRETFTPPPPPETINANSDRILEVLRDENPQTRQNALNALSRAYSGENVQPAELKLLARVFGPEVENLLTQANTVRVKPNAALSAEALARAEKARPLKEIQIAKLEEKALAQFEHADKIAADLTMDPTNAYLKKVEAVARQRGERAQALADQYLVQRTDNLTPSPVDALESLAKQRTMSLAVDGLRKAELAQRSGRALTDDQAALLAAKEQFGRKLSVASNAGKGLMDVVNAKIVGDRAILDAIKTDQSFMTSVKSAFNGDPHDSFVTNAMIERNISRAAYEQAGVEPIIATKMAGVRFDEELALHYGDKVPQSIRDMISKASGSHVGGVDEAGFFETLTQRFKNTMFGFDFGVAGVQGLNAIRRDPIGLLAGSINRGLTRLQLPHIDVGVTGSTLAGDVQAAIDGVHFGSAASAARPEMGTVLRYVGESNLPGASKVLAVDDAIASAVGGLTRLQFEKGLGTLRSLDHEGHLAILKALGRNIDSPLVRRAAADNANTITSFARAALDAGRRNAENTMLISASMTRARVDTLLQMSKLLAPSARPEQRILAASMILGTYVVYASVGKWLNDKIGVTDYIFDPSKPGAGVITSKFKDSKGNNIKIDVVPQDAIERAAAQSIRILTDPRIDDKEAVMAWERVALGSAGPVPRGVLGAGFGIGFEPGKGYRYGTLSGSGRIQSVLPIPPGAANAIQGEAPLVQGLGFIGVGAYAPEHANARPSRPSRPTRPSRP